MKKKTIISLVCIILAIASVLGSVLVLFLNNRNTANTPNNTHSDTNDTSPDDPTTQIPGDSQIADLSSPTEGHTPIPDLNEGNEVYLDMDVVARLQEMEDAGNEDEVNLILDTMLLLINEFVDRGYSPIAISQIQRFYFTYRSYIGNVEFDTLCNKLEACVPSSGANISTFSNQVRLHFGFGENTDFSYIYSEEVIS